MDKNNKKMTVRENLSLIIKYISCKILLFMYFFTLLMNFLYLVISLAYMSNYFVIAEEDIFRWVTVSFSILTLFSIALCITYNFTSLSYSPSTSINLKIILVTIVFVLSFGLPFSMFFISENVQNFYHETFVRDIKMFDSGESKAQELTWLNNIQIKYRCCGYKEEKDYNKLLKPPSCCDDAENNDEQMKNCRNNQNEMNMKFMISTSDINYHFYNKGCADQINEIINTYSQLIFYSNIFYCFVMIICMILFWLKRGEILNEKKNRRNQKNNEKESFLMSYRV